MAGNTNDISAHTVLPTSEANTANPGTHEAKTANTITTIARLMYIPNFPSLVDESFVMFPSMISFIGWSMIGNVNTKPKHKPICVQTKKSSAKLGPIIYLTTGFYSTIKKEHVVVTKLNGNKLVY